MYIRRFKYKAKDVDCKYCTEYKGKNKCPHSVCPYISERIEAGAVTYQDAVTAMVQPGCQIRNSGDHLYPGVIGGQKMARAAYAELTGKTV